jgi:hypothetical protein
MVQRPGGRNSTGADFRIMVCANDSVSNTEAYSRLGNSGFLGGGIVAFVIVALKFIDCHLRGLANHRRGVF